MNFLNGKNGASNGKNGINGNGNGVASVLELHSLAEHYGLTKIDPVLSRLIINAVARPNDEHMAQLLRQRLEPQIMAAQLSGWGVFPNPPAGNEVAGAIQLGFVEGL